MKIKESAQNMLNAVKSITDNSIVRQNTFLALDISGNMSVENFKELLCYDEDKIALKAGEKQIYIYGEDLKVLSYNKYDINLNGKINKIEIFEVK